ncbi:zinc finger protein 84-like [Macrosteles quadrilineatus]|uniref:zinc finger protein 84-like n=1 Tax=Macrosteles quadrilineatus TaxID=74068 RepID=UPI0023E15F6B|nr:zinc finger protein 84-like [Macrosteles quadrilineatus]
MQQASVVPVSFLSLEGKGEEFTETSYGNSTFPEPPDGEDDRIFRCNNCMKAYKRKGHLNQHIRYECNKDPQFACHLYPRILFFMEDGEERFRCSTCNRIYKRRPVIIRHLRYEFAAPATVTSMDGSQRFGCSNCGRSYKHKYNYHRHLRYECVQSRQFPCSMCSYKANYKQALANHIAYRHSQLSQSQLNIEESVSKAVQRLCRREPEEVLVQLLWQALQVERGSEPAQEVRVQHPSPVRLSSLSAQEQAQTGHEDTHSTQTYCLHGDETRQHVCDVCGRRYKHQSHLIRHKNYECSGVQPQFSCPYCDHKARPTNQCPSCDKKFKHRTNLLRHLRFECNREPRYSCSECPYRGKYRQHLQRHKMHRHPNSQKGLSDVSMKNQQLQSSGVSGDNCVVKLVGGQPRYFCSCGRSYKLKGGLQKHQRYECGKEPRFSCPHCPYKAKQKTSLTSHMMFKHKTTVIWYSDKPHICPTCGKRYMHKRHLIRHERYECGKEPQFACGDSFLVKVVDGKPRYFCSCGRHYKRKGGLSQHQRYECGREPQFSCPLCPYKAKQKTSLTSHMMFKHKQTAAQGILGS